MTLGHGIKDEMREHADLVIDSLPVIGARQPDPHQEVRTAVSA